MSETVAEPAVTTAEPELVESATETVDAPNEVEKWKALARKNEQRAKENADKAKRLDEIEEASKTELQKLLDRAEKAEKEAADATLKALRADVSSATGVPAGLLAGETEEELRASAAALLEFRGKTPAAPPANGVQGGVGAPINGGATQLNRDQLRGMSPEAITKAKAEGRLNQLLGINT